MIYGHISARDGYSVLTAHPVWRQAFEWIRQMPADVESGIHQIRGDDIYVNVHGYDTLPRENCRFESHRRYCDLQYCIQGGEQIDWMLTPDLQADGAYDESKDLQFYQPADSRTAVQMLPGSYAIFYPSDAHRPKVSDGLHPSILKLVVKIKIDLLAPQ